MKATTSEFAKKRFDKIVKTYILESPLPDVKGILDSLADFEKDIVESVHNGELKYLPLGNAKAKEAYKDPYTQQSFRGAYAWNKLYPAKAISFPTKISLLKLKIFRPEDIAELSSKYPHIYNVIMNDIFNCKEKGIADKGLQVIGIPQNESIPEWCFPYIDYNTVVNNILGQFQGVLDTFDSNSPEVGKNLSESTNRKTKKFSNNIMI